MRPVTDKFLGIVRGSHTAVFQAKLVAPGQTGVNPIGTELDIIQGDVLMDATASVRSTLELTTNYKFERSPDGLSPYGNEIYVRRGIQYGDGNREWVGLGYFKITDVDQESAPKGTVRVAASDRMYGINEARMLAPLQFGEGASVQGVFDLLVGEVYPGAVILFDFDAATTTFPGSHIVEESRYDFLKDIADSFGKIMYWDYQGRLRVESAPNPAEPVWQVNAGKGGVLTRVSRSLSRDGVYNAVVATGEPAGELPPVRAVALDENPASPTYFHGPFGQVPKFYSSSFITTTAQAQDAANAMLQREMGTPYSADFSLVPNPALEVLDPVQLEFSNTDIETHVIETLRIPLDAAGAMEATTKQQAL